VTDFLDEKRQEITARLKELKPLVEEYERLAAAAAALQGVGGSSAAATRSATATAAAPARKATGKRGPGRPKGSKTRTAKAAAPAATATATPAAPAKRGAAKRKAGRRKGSGTRAAQALSFVSAQPGITIPELAARMGIKQNYLYRVLPSLEEEGKVAKQGRGWHPKS
jgi:hypothetical protein